MKKNFVSNSSESIRMFKSGFLESLSKVSFYVPLIVYVPVILYLCWKSLFEDTFCLACLSGHLQNIYFIVLYSIFTLHLNGEKKYILSFMACIMIILMMQSDW